ncbi:hypothetical protein C8J57DRAFT_1212742 [Mycena rebaudengoi]|nr:hypothetical protein C8J57DRAFT_1212742 [Mycena rebaudengoi]
MSSFSKLSFMVLALFGSGVLSGPTNVGSTVALLKAPPPASADTVQLPHGSNFGNCVNLNSGQNFRAVELLNRKFCVTATPPVESIEKIQYFKIECKGQGDFQPESEVQTSGSKL